MNGLDFVTRDATYFLVIDAGSSMDDVVDELGWSPLTNPIDGHAWGSPEFHPFHDHLQEHDGWFELMVSAGNDAVFVLLIQNDDRVPGQLLDLCRHYA